MRAATSAGGIASWSATPAGPAALRARLGRAHPRTLHLLGEEMQTWGRSGRLKVELNGIG